MDNLKARNTPKTVTSYEPFGITRFNPQPGLGLLNTNLTLVRKLNEATNSFEPEYVYSHRLGRGFEGQADIYTSRTTDQSVVIKTFFSFTREEYIPKKVAVRLLRDYNITEKRWPVDISATLRRYNAKSPMADDLTVHPIDVFYVPRPEIELGPRERAPLPWRMVLPLYNSGSLDFAQAALAYLNLTTTEIDFLYRPRYKTVFEALGRMHTTMELESNATGFCHDDIKIDNLFLRNEAHEIMVGDMGQSRPLSHAYHKKWYDCRLVDAHRAWKTYLVLLRGASDRSNGTSEFDEQFMSQTTEWAAAYWNWMEDELILPEHMFPKFETLEGEEEEDEDEGEMNTGNSTYRFWGTIPKGTINFPVYRKGRIEKVAMGREEAIREVEVVRKELAEFKKARSSRTGYAPEWVPWWWWNITTPVANKTVEYELRVVEGQLVGLEDSWW
ncbi:hypothetical protein BDD12DRAFT_872815 [Trichophaea hybrida]|nr:hypothetical protein BDD12DRAFT_872815 [Trichophaea hybrida]